IVLDDQGLPIDSIIVVKDKVIQETTEQLKFTLQDGLAGWVRKNRQPALVTDTSLDGRWQATPGGKQSGPKSVVAAPLLARERLVGVLTLTNPAPGLFTEEHLALVKIIGEQAAFAVLNARLYAESQRNAGIMTAIAESASAIGASLDLEQVLQTILEQTTRALEVEAVSLALINPAEKLLSFRAATGKRSKQVLGMRIALGQGVAGWVAQEGKGVVVQDVESDPRFHAEVDKL